MAKKAERKQGAREAARLLETVVSPASLAAISTFIWAFLAHSYMWFNAGALSHDGLGGFVDRSSEHAVRLGRFLRPAYVALRGAIASSFITGVLGTVFLALAVIVLVRMFRLTKPLPVFVTAGFAVANMATILLNASYVHDFDAYMLALLLAVLASYATVGTVGGAGDDRSPKQASGAGFTSLPVPFRPVLGALCLAASMGLYQAYLSVFCVLCLLHFIVSALDGCDLRQLGGVALRWGIALLAGLVLYYLGLQLALSTMGLGLREDSYNSIADVGDFSGASPVRLLVKTYAQPIIYLLYPETLHPGAAGVITACCLLCALVGIFFLLRRRNASAPVVASVAAALLALPLAANLICLISKGMVHGLMIYAFFLAYLLVVLVLERVAGEYEGSLWFYARRAAFLGMGLMLVWTCIYGNMLYFRKTLESQTTLALATRIVDRVEQTEGFVVGETPIAFVGDFTESPLVGDHFADAVTRTGRDPLPDWARSTAALRSTGFAYTNAITHFYTIRPYFQDVLGWPIKLVSEPDTEVLGELPQVQAMPAFPDAGSVAWVDDVLVVKVSEL